MNQSISVTGMRSSSWHVTSRFWIIIPMLLVNGTAGAQVLEEIVVTAQKREQSLQDVGVSVTALSGDQITALGLTNTNEIAAQAPGVRFTPVTGTAALGNPAIRGVSQGDFAPHQETPNAMYVDDGYVSFIGGIVSQMYDMERVEILRGPQGTLFGRNATGGLVHVVTRKPTDEFEAFGNLTVAEYDQIKFEGAVGGPFTESLMGRLSVATNNHDGYVENRLGKDQASTDALNGRAQLLWKASEQLEVQWSLFASRDDRSTGAGYQHRAADRNADGLGVDIEPDQVSQRCLLVTGVLTPPGTDCFGYADTDNDAHAGDYSQDGFLDRTLLGTTGRITWQGDGFTVTSITHYMDMDYDYREDSDVSPIPFFEFELVQDGDQVSEELRINGEGERIRWVAGFYYLNIDADHKLEVDVPIFLADGAAVYNQETESWAVFGQGEYDIAPQWTIIAGLRWSEEDKDYDFNLVCDGLLCPLVFPAVPGTVSAIGSYQDTQSDGDYSAKFQVNWHPTDEVLVFAGVTRGTKAGGYNAPPDGLMRPDEMPFDPEVLTSYETGVKVSFWDERARFNASVFYYDYSDFQAFDLRGITNVITNADAEMYGMDAELFVQPAEGWDLLFGISLLEAEVFDIGLPSGRVVDREPPQSPGLTLNGLARKSWPLWTGKAAVQMDFSYTGEYQAGLANAPATEISDSIIGNARVSYGAEDDQWEVSMFVKNLADAEAEIYAFDVSGFGVNQGVYAPPRWFGGQFIYRWQ